MRKILFIMSIMFLFVIVSACGNEKVDGDGKRPADIPVEWVNAEDSKKSIEDARITWLKIESIMILKIGLIIKNDIKEYKLTEWKATDDSYFYEIIYQHPIRK